MDGLVTWATRRQPGDGDLISTDEARARWQAHQTAIQTSLGRPSWALRVAPPGSLLYRAAKSVLGRHGSSSTATPATTPRRLTPGVSPTDPAESARDLCLLDLERGVDDIEAANARVLADHNPWVLARRPGDRGALPDGLAELVAEADSDVDIVYADEIGPEYENLTPSRPGIHSLWSYRQLGRSTLIRRDAWVRIGGLDSALGAAALDDLVLRLLESGATSKRSERVLTWSTTPPPFDGGATHAALQRRGRTASVEFASPGVAEWRVSPPSPEPTVDILIPTRDRLDLIQQCISSIRSHTTYANYRIVVLDNDSTDPATLDYLASGDVAVTRCPGPFNYASIINRGVAASSAEYVVTLNNDIIVTEPAWLTTLVGMASLDDVGIVGPRLVDRDGRSDHDGITVTPFPQHLQRGVNYPWDDEFVRATRDVAAVTGACQAFKRRTWNEVGGMDESLGVTFNDVDICLRMNLAGYETLFTPFVELVHVGKASRGSNEGLEDNYRFIQYWDIGGSFFDPYCPARLELRGPTYTVRP